MNKHYQQWDELMPRALMLIMAGMGVLGQAIVVKSKDKGFMRWFFFGVIGLGLLNAGLSIFGESIKHRTLYELDVKAMRDAESEA